MKTSPIVPAQLSFNNTGVPRAPNFDDIYHPHAGAFVQAQHVFLNGNGLPARWQGRDRFVVLETGFGLGNNFLATWNAWRHDPLRCRQLHFISIEKHPLTREDLRRVHLASPAQPLADELVAAWPPLTPNLHHLSFDAGRVQLLLALGDVQQWLPELVAQVDAFYLDGFAPSKNPQMWEARVFKALGRLAATGATAATWTAARAVREGLASAGFEVRLGQGTGGKRDITLATYSPAFTPRRSPARATSAPRSDQAAVIVGAGLAGCAAAWALAEQGWHSIVLDRHPACAQEASGNEAGLFHGIFNSQDGAHARFNRAAALEIHKQVQHAIDHHGVAGSVAGLLRLESTLADAQAMRDQLTKIGLPADYVQALSAEDASASCSLQMQQPAWLYPKGGWVAPAGLARAYLKRAAEKAEFRGNTVVDRIERIGDQWQLLDAQGACIALTKVVVLANAGDALRLLNATWPIARVRGQISIASPLNGPLPSLPRLPIAGSGYLLPPVHGRAVFGATSHPGDAEAAVREADHWANLRQLARLTGTPCTWTPADLQGRVGWRWVTPDRLPVVGAVPDLSASDSRQIDQPRFVVREPGLYVLTALGSRGITWSALAAQALASAITSAPSPIEASLLDSIDPARFITRAVRRQATPSCTAEPQHNSNRQPSSSNEA